VRGICRVPRGMNQTLLETSETRRT
jgi:hypothetical protein